MLSPTRIETGEAAELLGDWQSLAGRLGTPENPRAVALGTVRVNSLPALRTFVEEYRRQILIPVELPAIAKAHEHASRYEARELIELDRQLGREGRLQDFAAASRGVGRRQLNRLRPLRDQRVVQRYLAALDGGTVHGWHTLVYGLTLSIYSLPLRQGLLNYAHQTVRGFVGSAADRLGIGDAETEMLIDEILVPVPAAMEPLLVKPAVC